MVKAKTTPKKVSKKPSLKKIPPKTKGSFSKCKKPKLKTGVIASYGELLNKKGDGTSDRDHIPSNGALQKRAERLKGKKLSKTEKSRVKRRANAIVLPKPVHKIGRTYGGKNTAKQRDMDADDLSLAAKRDIQKYEKSGQVPQQTLNKMTNTMVMDNAQYDDFLKKCFD